MAARCRHFLAISLLLWLPIPLRPAACQVRGGCERLHFLVTFLPHQGSTFVPIASMPGWLPGFARNQPVTPVVETLRGLLLGTPVGAAPWRALAWCAGILLAPAAASGVLFRLRTR